MMFSRAKATDRLDFIARQLAGLMEEHSANSALARVAEECAPEYAVELEAFTALLKRRESDSAVLDASAFKSLERLLPMAAGAGSTLFRAYNDYLQRSRIIFDTYWAGIASLTWYLGIISIMALLLGTMVVLWVLPPLGGVYESHGATLPGLTQAFFQFGDLGLPLVGIVLVASVGLMIWFALRFRNRIQKLSPLPRWPAWFPLFGSIAETYNLGLFLNFTRMLRQCGVAAGDAVAAAASASNQADDLSLDVLTRGASEPGPGNALKELGIAARLGNFDTELDHQVEQHVGALTRTLVAGRERLALLLKLLVFAVVAAVVIAIYLPIFDMAAII